MNAYRDLVLEVQKSIERFCLDFKTQVSAKAYEWLECMDQGIDHDLAELDEQSNQIEDSCGRSKFEAGDGKWMLKDG